MEVAGETQQTLTSARSILHSDSPVELKTALDVAKDLKGQQRFGLARRVLTKARFDPSFASAENRVDAQRIVQQEALCLSKDASLPDRRHEDALELLERGASLKTTDAKETLGIAGGINKRLWRRRGQGVFLTRALGYYERGHNGPETDEDYGYNAINAAFLNDQLADHDASSVSMGRSTAANELREALVVRLPRLQDENDWLAEAWWYLVTVAEAFLGLEEFDDAGDWLSEANRLTVSDWEKEVTATQLADLARFKQTPATSPPRPVDAALEESAAPTSGLAVVGNAFPTAPVEDLGRKFGLALSGGGFRASLFHLGVLARLADADVLRRVEVISCVSGGSIVGTHFYLELKRLLESKPDQGTTPGEGITVEDYRDVVRRVQRAFLAGIQQNLRNTVLANARANLQVLFSRHTRTLYMGELFEMELFGRIEDGHKGPRWVTDLLIQPHGEAANFHPEGRNWQRRNKVPALILNATTLNTGHLWQFHATYMGEPPGAIDPQVDRRERLRRVHYEDAPEPHDQIRLGHAVAASASVPGLFEPLELDGLYPDRTVRLVDGGVYDNQGVEGARMADCRAIFVSDASGPLIAEHKSGGGRVDASVRSNAISLSIVRDREHQRLNDLATSGSLLELKWVHLIQDVEGGAIVDWVDCHDRSEGRKNEERDREEIEGRIGALRTDLDSFSEVESFALMHEGYRMAERAFPDAEAHREDSWEFLRIKPIIDNEQGYEHAHRELSKLLDAGSASVFKLWRIVPGLSPISAAIGSLLLGLALFLGLTRGGPVSVGASVRGLTIVAVLVLSAVLAMALARKVLGSRATVSGVLISVVALIGWIPLRFHKRVLEPIFLRLGTLERLLDMVKEDSAGSQS